MKTLVVGATGFLGSALIKELSEPVILSTSPLSAMAKFPGIPVYSWKPSAGEIDLRAFEGVGAIVNLAGESIFGRWTAEKKARILESRVQAASLIAGTVCGLREKPCVVLSASAVGYYGDGGDVELVESSPSGSGFLAEVCRQWEAAASPIAAAGIRTLFLRTGVVLGKGGALAQMQRPFAIGLGGRLGSGEQWMSWIAIEDVVGLVRFLLKESEVSGPVNVVSPRPVRNREFTSALARAVGMPAVIPVPSFALKMVFGEFAETLLASQRVLPRVALDAGYRFRFSRLDDFMANFFAKDGK
ncbi:MAG: TIGR01777 family oxidoreductase [Planctomycetota bacterium]